MGLFGTSTDELKNAGLLVHDEKKGTWVDLRDFDEEALPCQHIYLRFENGQKTCQRCGCARATSIDPEPAKTIWDLIREARQ